MEGLIIGKGGANIKDRIARFACRCEDLTCGFLPNTEFREGNCLEVKEYTWFKEALLHTPFEKRYAPRNGDDWSGEHSKHESNGYDSDEYGDYVNKNDVKFDILNRKCVITGHRKLAAAKEIETVLFDSSNHKAVLAVHAKNELVNKLIRKERERRWDLEKLKQEAEADKKARVANLVKALGFLFDNQFAVQVVEAARRSGDDSTEKVWNDAFVASGMVTPNLERENAPLTARPRSPAPSGDKRPGASAVDASSLTVKQLKKELATRGLDTTGLKAVLVGRYEHAIASSTGDAALAPVAGVHDTDDHESFRVKTIFPFF